jgi:hypothetical protein
MEKEACNIIDLHMTLLREFPTTQFLWQPQHHYVGYPYNFEWNGIHTRELVAAMKQHLVVADKDPELIQLTLHGCFIYYK